MCTVTFVKTQDKVIITSNRDESVIRPSAIAPKTYTVQAKTVLYPKDPKAGGTWYAVDEKGTVLVLLNGADSSHSPNPPYRKSRGLIVLDIIGAACPRKEWDKIDLDAIEPFTLILFQNQELFQLRWNGFEKSTKNLDTDEKYIWSSATLYTEEVRQERADLFGLFLKQNSSISNQELYDFHRYTNKENAQNGLVINRQNLMKTLSITQAVLEKNKVEISYTDLISQEAATTSFIIV